MGGVGVGVMKVVLVGVSMLLLVVVAVNKESQRISWRIVATQTYSAFQ